jgi:putative ABC transport system permease protein
VKRLTLLGENVRIAFISIKSNRVRAVLTMCIIAFGIMALVGILTAIDGIKGSLTNQFTMMGANSFSITSRAVNVRIGNKSYRHKNHSHISYFEATQFREQFVEPAWTSISFEAASLTTLRYKTEKTNPNVTLTGTDENYLTISGLEVEKGRNFLPQEVESGRHVVIIGQDIVRFLFPGVDPIGKEITLSGLNLEVIGVLKSKGSSFGGDDSKAIIPITTGRQYFPKANISYRISIMPFDSRNMEMLANEAEGVFRNVRNLNPRDESDFEIEKSDSIVALMLENIKFITMAATLIGIITLFGAAVGLMNIMLVSVTERTREIGTRKALGAKPRIIRQQFLYESVIIGQLGGLFGIILGIIIGNLVSLGMGSSFTVPWVWVIGGMLACFLVGVASGYIPAVKAASVDPIEALRYE